MQPNRAWDDVFFHWGRNIRYQKGKLIIAKDVITTIINIINKFSPNFEKLILKYLNTCNNN